MLPVERFNDFVKKNALFTTDSKILAAVSGGMDSVLMAHLLKTCGYNFAIAHCNFQLRGQEAIADQQFCARLALQLNVPFHTVNFDTPAFARAKKLSIQMAARDLRYQWFAEIAGQYHFDAIALAHHQNDAVETILLNLTRGTGIAGLHGILPKNGMLARPLLFINREEIQGIVQENQLSFVEDSSNLSAKYARNKIRLEVIPKLKELNPSLESTFEENLRYFKELEMLLAEQLRQLRNELFIFQGDEIQIAVSRLKALKPERLLLFGLLQEYGFNASTVDDMISSFDKHPGRLFESAGYRAVLDRGNLLLSKKEDFTDIAAEINDTDHTVRFANFRLNIMHDDSPLIIRDNPMAVAVDASLLMYPLTVRPWQQGDSFYPLGLKTRKKLSDFFIHEKIPLHLKRNVPLIVNGNGDIIWIGGYRPDERYKVHNQTEKVTIFELFKL